MEQPTVSMPPVPEYGWPPMFWPPMWYPNPFYPGFGAYKPPAADEQGTPPVPPMVPPPVQPMMPPYVPEPYPPPQFFLPEGIGEPGIDELTKSERINWRTELKWVFGVLAALVLLVALAFAGFYRATASRSARELLVPLVRDATEVRKEVFDNYSSLRSKARRHPSATYTIPGLGMDVFVKAKDITSLSEEELADKVTSQVVTLVYVNGSGDLPMASAKGAGEERAKATAATLLSALNARNHKNLLWPMVISGAIALILLVVTMLFCRGWGKALGVGIALAAAALPVSLFIRLANEFIFGSRSGDFRSVANAALRGASVDMLIFYDIALGAGALFLLVGVIGCAVARRTRERVPPFLELERPAEAIAGGPPLKPGMESPADAGVETGRTPVPDPGAAMSTRTVGRAINLIPGEQAK